MTEHHQAPRAIEGKDPSRWIELDEPWTPMRHPDQRPAWINDMMRLARTSTHPDDPHSPFCRPLILKRPTVADVLADTDPITFRDTSC